MNLLELSCCKNWQKKVPTKKLVWGIGDVWRFWTITNSSWMIRGSSILIWDRFGIIQNLQTLLFCRILQQGNNSCNWNDDIFCCLEAKRLRLYNVTNEMEKTILFYKIWTHCEGIKSWKSLCLLELSYTSHFMTGS